MFMVSEVLRRARLDQGMDLATVAARTKIRARYLQAIEDDDRKSLPGGFFYKSFVHQYATFLGVDTREIDPEIDRVLSADAPLPLPGAARQRPAKLSSHSWTGTTYLSYAAFVLILVACVRIDGWLHKSRTVPTDKSESRISENAGSRTAPSLAAGRVSSASVSAVAAGPAAAAPVAAARQDQAAAPAGSIVELALTATEETWLSVYSDGSPVFSGLLEANQTKTIEGKESAKLRVGNAAGLQVRLNGEPLGPLGAHGQVREMVFTPDKFQFVSSPNESE